VREHSLAELQVGRVEEELQCNSLFVVCQRRLDALWTQPAVSTYGADQALPLIDKTRQDGGDHASCAGCRRKSVNFLYVCYWQTCMQRSHSGIAFTQWSKNGFFATQGRHIAPINMKFGNSKLTTGTLPVPNLTFIGAQMWEYRLKTVKIWNFTKFSASIGSFKIFNLVAFCG